MIHPLKHTEGDRRRRYTVSNTTQPYVRDVRAKLIINPANGGFMQPGANGAVHGGNLRRTGHFCFDLSGREACKRGFGLS